MSGDLERIAGALPSGVREPAGYDTPSDVSGLTVLQVQILDFERGWWKHAGAKETEIRTRWDISSTRYYQLLNHLIDQPAAMAADVLLVKRLRRLRDARLRQRSARRDEVDQ